MAIERGLAWKLGHRGLVILAGVVLAAAFLAACGRGPGPRGESWPPGYITGDIPAQYQGRANPYSPNDQEAIDAGQLAYFTGDPTCGACHGRSGRGDGPLAPYMDIRPADFAAPPMLAALEGHQDYIFWWVSEGVAKTNMPAFLAALTEDQRWLAITYAWSLGRQRQPSIYETRSRPRPPFLPARSAAQETGGP